MFAIIPVIILAGGMSVGAFDDVNITSLGVTDEIYVQQSEMDMNAHDIAGLEPFPLD
jgi:hypothetical protein